jgi:hypothetical protein
MREDRTSLHDYRALGGAPLCRAKSDLAKAQNQREKRKALSEGTGDTSLAVRRSDKKGL